MLVTEFLRSMTLSSSQYLKVNVPYVHLLPEYRTQLDVSLSPEDGRKFLACCLLSENLPQFDFWEFPHLPLETNTPTILNGPTNRNPVDLNQVSLEARQLVHRPGIFRFRYLRAMRLKCAGAPSCVKCSSRRMISGTSAKKSGMLFSKKAL
jgi:hypothetical protein